MTTALRRSALALTSMALVSACGSAPGTQSIAATAASPSPGHSRCGELPDEGPPFNFQKPLGGAGVPLPSISAAAGKVPFDIYVPRGLGKPAKVLVTPGGEVLALVYNSTEYGTVLVDEERPGASAEAWRESVYHYVAQSQSTDPSVIHCGWAETDTIRNSQLALVTMSEDRTRADVEWLEGDRLQLKLAGPTLTRGQVLQLAGTV